MVQFYLPVHFLLVVSSITAGLTNAFVTPSIGAFVGPTTTAPTKQSYSNMKFPTVGGTALSMASSGSKVTPPILSDETLAFLMTDIANDKGITDYDEEKTLAIVKQAMMDAAPKDTAVSVQSYSLTASSSCEWAILDFSIEAVGLGLAAAGMPSGAGKRVAKILVKKAKDALMKEMKGIVKDYFGSPNPANIAAGLIKIFSIIIGETSLDDVLRAIKANVSWLDAFAICFTFAMYFASGGGGLIAKLGLMTPAIIDVVQAGVEVEKAC
jgi:hypothetical protein